MPFKIDRLEKIHGRSFNTIQWLEEQINKLNENR